MQGAINLCSVDRARIIKVQKLDKQKELENNNHTPPAPKLNMVVP